MFTTSDQLGRTLEFKSSPSRIVSLVPSQTELLYDLGLESEIVGITKFCIHPKEWFNSKTRVGGTKQLDLDKIRSLQPDLIIGNKEENDQEQVHQLMKEFPVWMSDIYNLNDACQMIDTLGQILGKHGSSQRMIRDIADSFKELENYRPEIPKKTAYLIWKEPWMVAGRHTFINDMLERCGFVNIFSGKLRYPETNPEELLQMKPELVLLSSEPYPFKEKELQFMKELLPEAEVFPVDGEAFSWHGSRLLKAPEYFKTLFLQINSAS